MSETREREFDEALVKNVALAIARAGIKAAEPQTGRLSDGGIEKLAEYFALRCYPEARAAIETVSRTTPSGLPESTRETLSDCAEFLADIDGELARRCEAALSASTQVDAMRPLLVEARNTLQTVLDSCGKRLVGGGDGQTYSVNPPSGVAWNLALALLAKIDAALSAQAKTTSPAA